MDGRGWVGGWSWGGQREGQGRGARPAGRELHRPRGRSRPRHGGGDAPVRSTAGQTHRRGGSRRGGRVGAVAAALRREGARPLDGQRARAELDEEGKGAAVGAGADDEQGHADARGAVDGDADRLDAHRGEGEVVELAADGDGGHEAPGGARWGLLEFGAARGELRRPRQASKLLRWRSGLLGAACAFRWSMGRCPQTGRRASSTRRRTRRAGPARGPSRRSRRASWRASAPS
jgi:hypothetical protein